MRRRTFVAGMSALATGVVLAQPRPEAARTVRVGILRPTAPATTDFPHTIPSALREFGYVEGRNASFELAYAGGNVDRLPALARDLVHKRMDVIVTIGSGATLAVKEASATVPIVMFGNFDPLAMGIVASLSRPGGNVTGTSAPFSESAGKGLEVLKEAVPGLRRVAIVWNPANEVFQAQMLAETRAAAQRLGIELAPVQANDSASIDRAFAEIAKLRVDAVNVLGDPVLAASWPRIASLATKMRLPSVTVSAAYAEAGGLMTYGPSLPDSARVAGGHVAKVLRGARAGDLPVERSVKFELVINERTAKAIGYAIPPSLRLRADRIIE